MKSLTWKLHFRSSPVPVYYFLSTDWGRQQFWAESAQQQEQTILFKFSNGEEYAAQLLECQPAALYSLDYFGSQVTFELQPDKTGGTDLTLSNTNISEEDFLQMHSGWVSVLLALKAACDFGVDLRNHHQQRTWDQLYVDN